MEKGPKQNPEIEKNNFRQRYDAIMSREPTVEDINSYADKALEDLIYAFHARTTNVHIIW